MSRINKSVLTKLEIIQVATRLFLEQGYSKTTVKAICRKLDMSTGNLTFYYPTKEHLLAELVGMMCDFQWRLMEEEANEGYSSIMAICLELAVMVAGAEQYEIAKDFYLSAYTSPLSLELMRKNDEKRAREVFREYLPDWTDEQFAEAEILVSGVEYATLMTTPSSPPAETRIASAIDTILGIYGIPKEMRKQKIERVLAMDYKSLAKRVLREFTQYVEDVNENAFLELIKDKK